MFLPHDWQSDLCFLHASTVVHNSKNRDTASLIQCIWNQASNQNTVYSSWHFILLLYLFSVSPWRGGGRDGEVSTWCQELLCPVTPSTCIINCVVPLCVCDSATQRGTGLEITPESQIPWLNPVQQQPLHLHCAFWRTAGICTILVTPVLVLCQVWWDTLCSY